MKQRFLRWGVALALLAPAGAAAQSGGYLVTLGRDTIAAESYTATPGLVRGASIIRTPRTLLREYELKLGPGRAPLRYQVVTTGPGSVVLREETYEYGADSVRVTIRRDTAVRRVAIATRERPLPFSEDIIEPWATTLRRAHGDTLTVLTAARAWRLPYSRHGDTVRVPVVQWGTARFRVNPAGELAGGDLTATTAGFVITRVPPFDVRALVARFAREDASAGLTTLSPRDTVRATLGDVHVLIDYGRPSVRGRRIFGGAVVPWGRVWRTGANAATQLITDRDLVIGGTVVRAGKYSLWTLPTAGAWQLIVNKQHGQWGTQYDSAQDLVRIPAQASHLASPVEMMQIRLDSTPTGADLVIDWADTRVAVPVKPRE